MDKVRVSIIIPAYNEEKRIEKTLRDYLFVFDKNTEIVVVCNGCKDKTPEIVSRMSAQYQNLICINVPELIGKGGAIIEGFKYAKSGIVGYVDADGATKAVEFKRLISLLGDDIEGVIGSRWLKGAEVIHEQPFIRKMASRTFNFLVRSILRIPYRDTQCGAKVFQTEAIDRIIDKLGVTNLAFDIDLLYNLHETGCKIREEPTVWEDKSGSSINLKKDAPLMFASLVRLRIKHSYFKNWVK